MDKALLGQLACATLTIAWANGLDAHAIEATLDTLSDDAVFHSRAGDTVTGRDAIRTVIAARDPERTTRHVLAPPFILIRDADNATGVTNFVVYDSYVVTGDARASLPLESPVTVGEFHHSYKRTSDGWRISEHRSVGVFRRPA